MNTPTRTPTRTPINKETSKLSPLKDPKVIDVLRTDPTGMKLLLNDYYFQYALVRSNYWKNMKNNNMELYISLSRHFSLNESTIMLNPQGNQFSNVVSMFKEPRAVDAMIQNENFMSFILNDLSQEALKVPKFVEYVKNI